MARPLLGTGRASALKFFARKVDAEGWLKVSEAGSLTGRWVDPAAGAEPFGPYAEEWITVKRSRVGETTATNTESLLRERVLPEFGAMQLKRITAADVRNRMARMTNEGLAASTIHTYRRVLAGGSLITVANIVDAWSGRGGRVVLDDLGSVSWLRPPRRCWPCDTPVTQMTSRHVLVAVQRTGPGGFACGCGESRGAPTG